MSSSECKSHFYAKKLFYFVLSVAACWPAPNRNNVQNCFDSQKMKFFLQISLKYKWFLRLTNHHHNHPDSGHLLLTKGDLLLWRSCSEAGRTLWRKRGTGEQVLLILHPIVDCWLILISDHVRGTGGQVFLLIIFCWLSTDTFYRGFVSVSRQIQIKHK